MNIFKILQLTLKMLDKSNILDKATIRKIRKVTNSKEFKTITGQTKIQTYIKNNVKNVAKKDLDLFFNLTTQTEKKEKRKEKQKQYYEKNKEKIKIKASNRYYINKAEKEFNVMSDKTKSYVRRGHNNLITSLTNLRQKMLLTSYTETELHKLDIILARIENMTVGEYSNFMRRAETFEEGFIEFLYASGDEYEVLYNVDKFYSFMQQYHLL